MRGKEEESASRRQGVDQRENGTGTHREEKDDRLGEQQNQRSKKTRLDDLVHWLFKAFLLSHEALISRLLSKLLRSPSKEDDGVGLGKEQAGGGPS